MDNVNLSYDSYSKNNQDFFDMQDVIKDDFKRIKYIVEDYYEKSEFQENLVIFLNSVINNIQLNRFEKEPEMELNILLTDNYLIFSFYEFLDEKVLFDTPSIVIFSRNIDKIYFINEIYSIFRDEEVDDEYNRGRDEIRYFELKDGKVRQYETTLEEYTCDLFFNSFNNIIPFLSLIESMSTLTEKNRCCATCEWCISPELEKYIIEEQGYSEDDDLRTKAGDCCLGIDCGTNYYCESYQSIDCLETDKRKILEK